MCLAVPGKILTIMEEENLGLRRGEVDFSGIRRDVCLDYTPEARVGDYVLVHLGFALTVMDECEAQRIFKALRQIDQLEELQESCSIQRNRRYQRFDSSGVCCAYGGACADCAAACESWQADRF